MSHSPVWRKSSRSSDLEKAVCVEVAAIDRARAIRDSKDPDGPRISMSIGAWRGFIGAVKNDAFGG
jgi:hypothetical protein